MAKRGSLRPQESNGGGGVNESVVYQDPFHPAFKVFSAERLLLRLAWLRVNERHVAADELKVAIEKLTGDTVIERAINPPPDASASEGGAA